MAINSVSSASRGLSGLVSGMNTEEMVDKLLSATQSKIDAANVKKIQLTYKRDLYRGVSSELKSLQSKYFSFAGQNSTNFLSTSFFKSLSTTATDSKVLTAVATTSANVGKTEIEVKQLAQNMSISTQNGVASGAIKGNFSLENLKNSVKNGSVTFDMQLDGVTKAIVLNEADVASTDTLKKALEKQIAEKFGGGIKVDVTNDKNGSDASITFDTEGNRTVAVMSDASFLGVASGASNRINLNTTLEKSALGSKLEGDRFEFSINGVDFSFDKSANISRVIETVNSSNAGVTLSYSAINDSFKLESSTGGAGSQISLEQRSGNLLSVMFGEAVIGKADKFTTSAIELVDKNSSGKITGETKLSKIGLKGGTLTIGSESISYNENMTIAEFNQLLADKKLSAEIGLNNSPPRFVFAGAKIPMPISIAPASQAGGTANTVDASEDFKKLFGNNFEVDNTAGKVSMKAFNTPKTAVISTDTSGKVTVAKDGGAQVTLSNAVAGQNAKVSVNGTELERNSNNFTVDGISLELNSVGTTTVNVTNNNDSVYDGIKSFMEDYNKLIDKMWTYMKEDTNYKEYAPLTDEQKAEMSEGEIKLWEEKTKEGLLRADSTLARITEAMRTVLNTRVNGVSLADLGISTTYDMEKGYGGKLIFTDSTGDKLREALSSNAENVRNLFLGEGGISSKFNEVLRSATTAGKAGSEYYQLSLVDIAGSTGVPDTSSKLYAEMNDIDKNIAKLEAKYEKEYTRYWNQFNAMEKMISQMNQQSSWLSQQFV